MTLKNIHNKKEKTKLRILVADDDQNFSYVLKKELEEKSYIVDVANNGVDAILNFLQKEYGFILLDLKMPRLNGMDTLKIIGALKRAGITNSGVQVITLSGGSDEKRQKELLHAGAVKHIKKPFSIEALTKHIQNIQKH